MNETETTTFKITVAVIRRWPTGALHSTGSRTIEVEEDATILGGCRAIDKACDLIGDKVLADTSPSISPNPAELGWPLGLTS